MRTVNDLKDALAASEQPPPPVEAFLAEMEYGRAPSRHRARRILAVAAAAAVVLAIVLTSTFLAGAGRHDSPTGSTGSNAATPVVGAHYRGRLAAPTTVFDGDLVMRPPGAAVPSVTWQEALAACARSCTAGASPEITLAVVTTPNSGSAGPGGSIIPSSDNALTYVLVSHSACGLGTGKMIPPNLPQVVPNASDRPCMSISLVDARTGMPGIGISGADGQWATVK